jgi:hypothetical protein
MPAPLCALLPRQIHIGVQAYSAATWLLRRAAKFCVDTDQCRDEPINHVAWLIRASMHWLATRCEE